MPPLVPRKRLRQESPTGEPRPAKAVKGSKGKAPAAAPRKATLYDDLDQTESNGALKRENSNLKHLEALDEEEDSDLTSLSDADFEDAAIDKRQRQELSEEEDDEDDDIEFEDVEAPRTSILDVQTPTGDLELTLIKDPRVPLTKAFGDKKGPSKRDRQTRNASHCLHVQLLLWHNAVRNAWTCDPEVQGILLSHLPPSMWDEVDRWRRTSGLEVAKEETPKKAPARKSKARGRPSRQSGKRGGDWDTAATRLEQGTPDLSHGDPLFRLMKALTMWWKKRFTISAPGIRKQGYMSLERLDRLVKGYQNEEHDAERFGERIRGVQEFRTLAQHCTGSRDVGAQLFTALLRGLGLEARLIASLQPVGFGWNKYEDADEEEEEKPKASSSKQDGASNKIKGPDPNTTSPSTAQSKQSKRPPRKPTAKDSDESEAFELHAIDSDDDSVIMLPPVKQNKKTKSYDKDLEYPHYWTEVLSPVTNKYLPVDAIVKAVVATNREHVESLEPRGGKADKARQVMAYIVGYSQDGTAKDVTVRYLKRQMLPGRTKGVRYPIAKIPVYNKHGKVKRYDPFDWFRFAMRGYGRGGKNQPITDVDEDEDSTDLKPAKPEKKEVKEGEETLQYYKQSQEFVLERHLRREEALLPRAKPVKVFKSKGKGGEVNEEDVFLRKDVVNVKSAETWHKQGRAPIPGQRSLKKVPYRAATTNRRREIAEAEAATGEKVLQGLYSFDQTDWIIPPPIENGVIPKNEYGNIDLFAEHMCPEGAVHVPYRGAVKVCKRLQIDFAEAVVDFEFGHRMAVPVIQGVVVAAEYHDQVMEELAKDEAERSRKEDEKRRKAAMGMWRKMLMGMRIARRIEQDYGKIGENEHIFGHDHSASRIHDLTGSGDRGLDDEEMAGGFLPEGFEDDADHLAPQTSSFFPVAHDEEDGEEGDGGLIVEDHRNHEPSLALEPAADPDEPESEPEVSKSRAKPRRAQPGKRPPRGRRQRSPPPDEDEDEDESELTELDLDSDADYVD
ncbi:uncharacterized protein E0L32_000544 [Thyridium curvatum]|uniref:Uncharacterized protein n=1 Tax=Thyridium curvatum TaxID=1093900 RepID=A0A507BC08_9PEZI|nr:uncharacterized protein E0L32_000544 [Thyridium curvatum]TPX14150.1 hypothetical protein E0L32_000544 [Thyridium curvatum]